MISFMGTMQPHLGNSVRPAMLTATGTSSLQGRAPDVTQQQHWSWALKHEQPSHSMAGPQQPQGRQGAPGCDRGWASRRRDVRMDEMERKARDGSSTDSGAVRVQVLLTLQQTSALRQHSPTFPEQPAQSAAG